MKTVSACLAMAIATVVIGTALAVAHAQQSSSDAAEAKVPASREPALPFPDAVVVARDFMTRKGLDKNWFVRSMQYEQAIDEGPCWTAILSAKFRAIEAEPMLRIKLDRSVELIPGE